MRRRPERSKVPGSSNPKCCSLSQRSTESILYLIVQWAIMCARTCMHTHKFYSLLFKPSSTCSSSTDMEISGSGTFPPVHTFQHQGQQMTRSEAFSLPGCKLKLSFPPRPAVFCGVKVGWRGLVRDFPGKSEGSQKAVRSRSVRSENGNLSYLR